MTFPSGGRNKGGRWKPATNVERDAIGTDDGLEVGDLCVVLADAGEYICTVAGVGASTWVAEATGGGGGGDLAATLVLGNSTGGTNLRVFLGDAIVATGINDPLPIAPGPGGNIELGGPVELTTAFPAVTGTGSVGLTGQRFASGFIDQLLIDGALAASAPADANDVVIGDGTGSPGAFFFGASGANFATIGMGRVGGTSRGFIRYNFNADVMGFGITNTERLILEAGELRPNATGGLGLGDATRGWSFGPNLQERAATPFTPTSGHGVFWARDDTPNTAVFTDDSGVDHELHDRQSRFQTVSSAANVDTAIATLSADGDQVHIRLQIIGVEAGGADQISRFVVQTYYRSVGTVTAITHSNDQQTDGVPTATSSMVISGNNIIARVNGDAAATHDWVVTWDVTANP